MELGVDIYFEIPTVTTRYSKTTRFPYTPGGGPARVESMRQSTAVLCTAGAIMPPYRRLYIAK